MNSLSRLTRDNSHLGSSLSQSSASSSDAPPHGPECCRQSRLSAAESSTSPVVIITAYQCENCAAISTCRPTTASHPSSESLITIIIALENVGIYSSTTLNFISKPGRRICVHTGDVRETLYLTVLLLLLSISVFLLFSFFSVFTFFSCRFRVVD